MASLEYMRAWRAANADRVRELKREHYHRKKQDLVYLEKRKDQKLKRDYGISLEDYNMMFTAQGGSCAICGKHQSELKRPLFVDHNHSNGEVRGLLCTNCNTMLGHGKDDPTVLYAAGNYLIKWEKDHINRAKREREQSL